MPPSARPRVVFGALVASNPNPAFILVLAALAARATASSSHPQTASSVGVKPLSEYLENTMGSDSISDLANSRCLDSISFHASRRLSSFKSHHCTLRQQAPLTLSPTRHADFKNDIIAYSYPLVDVQPSIKSRSYGWAPFSQTSYTCTCTCNMHMHMLCTCTCTCMCM